MQYQRGLPCQTHVALHSSGTFAIFQAYCGCHGPHEHAEGASGVGVHRWQCSSAQRIKQTLQAMRQGWQQYFVVLATKGIVATSKRQKGAFMQTRDGSYGLLRRPIRYNTLLIRNTRIIRKRYFGGYPGLAPTTLQPPRTVPPASRAL